MHRYSRGVRWMAAGLSCLLLSNTTACTFGAEESSAPPPTTTTVTTTTTTESTTETTTTTTEVTTTTTTAAVKQDVAAPMDGDALLTGILQNAAANYGGVGMQVAVIRDGQMYATAAYGWAEKKVLPMSTTTMQRIASPSKTIVAMVVMALVDQGLLGLDDDISQHLGYTVRHPSYPDTPITVRMLACHTSALNDASYVYSPEALQQHLTSGNAFAARAPGARYVYNNFAYGVLGTVCEYAAGNNFQDLAQEYLFRPMGINASFLADTVPDEQLAIIYTAGGGVGLGRNAHRNLADHYAAPGYSMRCYAGGLIISAADYARLLTLLMNGGAYGDQQILSSEAVAAMQTVQFNRGAIQQCLPMWRQDGLYGQSELYYHTGSAYGTYSLYVYNPANGTGVVVNTSGSSGARDTAGIYAVCSYVVNEVYGLGDALFGETLV